MIHLYHWIFNININLIEMCFSSPQLYSPIITIVCVFLQEWQNSIQKNAGLAFIELVNEGRWVTPLLVSFPASWLSATFQFHQSSITSWTPSLNLSSSADRVALYDSGLRGEEKKKSMIAGGEVEVELGRVRVDYLWVQVSVQYLPVPVGFGKRREVR